jgi:CRP/FNR family transcriptional regulator, cyclic AMP receptor protein
MSSNSANFSKINILGRHEFFSGLPDRLIQQLVVRARSIAYSAGDLIFREGEEGHGLLAVLSGVVRISAQSKDSKEIVLNLIGSGEIFGEIALLDGGMRTANASALTNCTLMVLDRRDFMNLLMQEPAVAVKLLEVVCRRLRRTTKQVEDLSFGDLRKRLASALLQIAGAQGTIESSEPRLQITQKELGNILGLSRESTNRHLREWEDAGLLALEKGVCIIKNPRYLIRLAKGSAE